MKEALFYKKQENNNVQCQLCPHYCTLQPEKIGICKVRQNIKGKLYSLVYNQPFGGAVDPIEKKPLFHFHPGQSIYSFGTVGCNLKCKHCQNWETSQASPVNNQVPETTPEEMINQVKASGCKMIAYTYNEPTIFYEYMLDIAKLAKKENIKNVIVSNGFINPEPLMELCKYIDAANIDLKSFDPEFHKTICKSTLRPVLETLKILKQQNIWTEITNLIIPDLNDDMKIIEDMCDWIIENLGTTIPVHFSAFYPQYKLQDTPPTDIKTIVEATNIAFNKGLKFVYMGNVSTDVGETTFCPNCHAKIIERNRFETTKINLKRNQCDCGEKINGIF